MNPAKKMCPICSYETKVDFALNVHNQRRHLMKYNAEPFYATNEPDEYRCGQCLSSFDYRLLLLKHLRLVHGNAETVKENSDLANLTRSLSDDFECFKCTDCRSVTNSAVTHLYLFNNSECCFPVIGSQIVSPEMPDQTLNEETKLFKCEHCSFTSERLVYLQHILQSHTTEKGIKWFLCKNCSYKSKPHISHKHSTASYIGLFQCEKSSLKDRTNLKVRISHKHSDNDQVVGVQQYPIRPQTADINENILSEQLTAESVLTDELIKSSGRRLEDALGEFDAYCAGSLHLDPHNAAAFRMVTDGQPPLRQCLYPEACRKDLDLPGYYGAFHDLRKEVARFCGKADDETPQSVTDMLDCLQLKAEVENEFYKKEAKDMVNIVQRLIVEGYRFEIPETINLTLEPGICSKDDEIDSNCVVRARGLPWQSSDQDIAKFFSGLNVAKGGVALCLSAQGRRNGEALIRFESQEHRDMALKRHKHHIGPRYIEVYRASGEDFLSIAGGKSSEAQAFLTRGANVIVRMRGLPYDCTAKQVLDFFSAGENSCTVQDGADGVLFVRKLDGRATGDAFVLFKEEGDAPKALSKHRECIGSRYIELFRSTTAEVQQVLNRSLESRTYEPEPAMPPLISHVPLLPQHIITSGTKKDCIRLRGLPYEAQVEHILEFLGDLSKSIVFQGVHMVYNAQGQPSGEAFIQMESEQAAYITAHEKHHRYMPFGKKQRYIEVFQCSGEDMNLVLTGGIPAPVSPAKAAAPTLLSPGGNIIPTAFHPGPNFQGYAPLQITATPLGPRQFLPPPIFYWPYPSPPVSPTNYFPTMAPPGALAPQQPQQAMIPPECVALPPMGPMPTMDARVLADPLHRQDHDKARQNFVPNQYVELII